MFTIITLKETVMQRDFNLLKKTKKNTHTHRQQIDGEILTAIHFAVRRTRLDSDVEGKRGRGREGGRET